MSFRRQLKPPAPVAAIARIQAPALLLIKVLLFSPEPLLLALATNGAARPVVAAAAARRQPAPTRAPGRLIRPALRIGVMLRLRDVGCVNSRLALPWALAGRSLLSRRSWRRRPSRPAPGRLLR